MRNGTGLSACVFRLGLYAFAACGCPVAGAAGFTHPGLLSTAGELQFVKGRIQAGAQPWTKAFEALRSDPLVSLTRPPHPRADIECGSYNNPDLGCDDATYDAKAAYGLALLWYFTQDKRYADKSIQYLDAWAAAYRSIGLSNAPLVSGWTLPAFANAAEILRYTDAGWSPAQIKAFTNMLLRWLPEVDDKEPRASNWIFSLMEAKMAIGIYTDNPALFNEAVAMWRKRAPTFSYLASDGPAPVQAGSTATVTQETQWHGQKVFVDGIAQETCRDIGHMLLGVGAMVYGAEMAWHQGVDLYGEERKRITAMLEFHGRWFNGEAVPAWLCGGALLLHPTTPFPASGIPSDNFEMAYNHYRMEGFALPQSALVVSKSRPAGAGGPVSKWETLTHASLPAGGGVGIAPRTAAARHAPPATLRVNLRDGAGPRGVRAVIQGREDAAEFRTDGKDSR
jgi:hypothetical protein